LRPGDLFMLLTNAEASELFGRGATGSSGGLMSFSMPPGTEDHLLPPLFRHVAATQDPPVISSEMNMLLGLLAAGRGARTTFTRGNTIGVDRAYAAVAAAADPVEADEELLSPEMMRIVEREDGRARSGVMGNLENVLRTLGTMTQMITAGSANAAAPSGVIKKVINMATFNRVCPVVSHSEIASLTTPAPQVDDGDDTVGGSRDAGLGGCSVCLSLLVDRSEAPSELRQMPRCTHKFHAACLAQWLTKNAITCPVCREPAVSDPKDYGYLGFGADDNTYTPAVDVSNTEDIPAWVPTFSAQPAVATRRR